MKDKLTKHHKKKSYFVMRKVFFIALGLLFTLSAAALPVTISYVVTQNSVTQAER